MRKFLKTKIIVVLALSLLSGLSQAGESLLINGAGATFPYPLYSKWFYAYHQKNPAVSINYQSIGSGGGIQQITAGTVDFGASDAPMSDAEIASLKAPLLHIPTVLGGVVAAYNEPSIGAGLKLTGPVLSAIFSGTITQWDDAQIKALNPGKALPSTPIFVAHRSDGSGTTYVFTDYLSKVSPAWQTKVGTGKSVNWPVGLGGKGNEGVAALVKQTPGSIGYMELSYALQMKINMASLQNKAGQFIHPSIDSISAAADGVVLPPDYRVSLTNSAGPKAYPISSFTYLLVYQKQTDAAKGKALVTFLKWALHDGQALAAPLFYAPLPVSLVQKLDQTVSKITVPGA